MRARISPALIFLVAAAVVCLLLAMRVERALNDTEPEAGQTAGTLLIDAPAPIPRVAGEKASYHRLSTNLLMVQSADVRVKHGYIRMPAGLPVKLVNDNGAKVDVTFGGRFVTVPRSAVVGTAYEPVSNPAETAMAWVERVIYAPGSSLTIEAKERGGNPGLSEARAVQVELRNLSRRPTGDCELSVNWIVRKLSDQTRYVHHAERFRINLSPEADQQFESVCPPLTGVANYVVRDRKFVQGGQVDGWMVVIERGGKLLVGRGSDATYNAILKDAGKRTALLATAPPKTDTAEQARLD
jgi:hypothetical protein